MRDLLTPLASLTLIAVLSPHLAAQDDLGGVTEKHVMVPMRDGKKLSTYLYFPQGQGPVAGPLRAALRRPPRRRDTQGVRPPGRGRLRRRRAELPRHAPVGGHLGRLPRPGLGRAEGRLRHRRVAGEAAVVHGQGRHLRQLAGRLRPELPRRHPAAAPRLPVHDRHRPEPVPRGLSHRRHDPARALQADGRRLPRPGGQPPAAARSGSRHPTYDDYWAEEDCTRHFDKMNVPCFTVGSWYDFMCVGSVESFIGRQHKGGPELARQAATPDRPLAARPVQGDEQGRRADLSRRTRSSPWKRT